MSSLNSGSTFSTPSIHHLRRLVIAPISVALLLAACGSSSDPLSTVDHGGDDVETVETEEEADVVRQAQGRADVVLDASLENDVLTLRVNGLDKSRLFEPAVEATLADYVVGELPSDCVATDVGFSCKLAGSLGSATDGPPPTEVVEWIITLTPTPGASVSSIDIIATSDDNPLDNDIDPTNNTATLTTAG